MHEVRPELTRIKIKITLNFASIIYLIFKITFVLVHTKKS